MPADGDTILSRTTSGLFLWLEARTLVSQIVADDSTLDQAKALIPASSTRGHLVLNGGAFSDESADLVEVEVGVNVFDSPVETGGGCGDGVFLSVLLPR